MKGVTIKDAMDAIHKAFKKRVCMHFRRPPPLFPFPKQRLIIQVDDELDLPYLTGFEWDKEESWTRLIVHLQRESSGGGGGGGGKKKKNKDE